MKKIDIIKNALSIESNALKLAGERISQEQVDKISTLFQNLIKSNGSIFFCGVGKSGYIALKLAATFTSLGLPAFFIHPTEALHGDLGRIKNYDAIVFISKSGNTEEIIKLLPYLNIPRDSIVALIGDIHSSIASSSGVVFDCSVEREACINDQAPTTSSTTALAVGDSLAVLYESLVGFKKEDFASFHPGGILGKVLHLKVKDIMIPASQCPILRRNSTFKDLILAMTNRPVGACIVCDGDNFEGLIVEGDIRRILFKLENISFDLSIDIIMNKDPIKIRSDELASKGLELMEKKQKPLNILPVIEDNKFLGILTSHSLIREGLSSS